MRRTRVRIRCDYALGDNVVLTAAVRDLHREYPGQFQTTIGTRIPDIWKHNPHAAANASTEIEIDCADLLVDRQGKFGKHYAEAFLNLLNKSLGTRASLSTPAGDIHLSADEKRWYSDIWSLCGKEIPFWLISSGGKFDIPVKWWDSKRYQEVVNALKGKIQFVQIGAWGDHHPRIEGAIDLRGKTTVRDLIHLVYHADGVLCGVTGLMHLAAAVPKRNLDRAAIIIAGAREPICWEKYPGHEYLSTTLRVSCGCCWKSSHDPSLASSESLCQNSSQGLPSCMDQISIEEVLSVFSSLADSGRIRLLRSSHYKFAAEAIRKGRTGYDTHNITPLNSVQKAAEFISALKAFPANRFCGRGIVICAGGVDYFAQAWVCIQMLRQHGCNLPVEVWHYGRAELDHRMEAILNMIGARTVNACEMMRHYPMRNPLGYELKSYALLHSSFKEVLLLDADNVPLVNPERLFTTPEFKETGAIFWPDYLRLGRARKIWKLCGVTYRSEPEFESGQMVIDKEKCWAPLNLAWWYNDHSEFFFNYIHGDKDTFHLAWRRLNVPYSMPPFPIHSLEGVMCQHDFQGRRIFQHRNSHKWSFWGLNRRISGFEYEADCLNHLKALKNIWDGRINGKRPTANRFDFHFRKGTCDGSVFESVVLQNEYRVPEFLHPNGVVIDIGAHIGSFSRACFERGGRVIHAFEPHPENFKLARKNLASCPGVELRNAAILSETSRVVSSPFPLEIGRENTGGSIVISNEGGKTRALAFDVVMQDLGRAALVKLDCEGSEWPIILNSKEWGRVQAVCGEYHEMEEHPLCPASGPFASKLLRSALRRHFKYVKTAHDKSTRFGKFWAANVKSAFPSVFE
jgi:FkbM family methyltransferase